MKKRLFWGLVACCAFILLCLTSCDYIANFVANTIIDRTAERRALPNEGLYVCSECDVAVSFCGREVTLIYGNSAQEQVNVDYGNNLFGTVTALRASIRWEQQKNQVVLVIKQGNEHLSPTSKHCCLLQ